MTPFTELFTSTGEVIRINKNVAKRHFTIKKEGSKYRTFPMSKIDFEEHENNTGNDWKNFLANSCYYTIN